MGMSRKVSNRRLLALARLLRKLPRSRFNYARWVGGDWRGAKDLSCGTVACALGWATTMPEMRRLGLELSPVCPLLPNETPGNFFTGGGTVSLRGKDIDSFHAGAIVFGISLDDADHLFAPGGEREERVGPKYVARKIERFVARRKKADAHA